MVMPVFLPWRRARSATRRSRRTGSTSAASRSVLHDTTDVFQEGVVFPGVKLFARGELVKDIYRMVIANTRMPVHVAGDVNAEVVGLRTGRRRPRAARRALRSRALRGVRRADVRPRRGGCALVPRADPGRPLRRPGPDGLGRRLATTPSRSRSRSRSTGRPSASTTRTRPTQRRGPVNCPLPMTVSVSRVVDDDARGQRRGAERGALPADRGRDPTRLDVPSAARPRRASCSAGRRRRPPTPRSGRSPQSLPELVPAALGRRHLRRSSGGASARRRASSGATASPHPVGQGASARGDGGSSLIHFLEAATRIAPTRGLGGEEPVAVRALRARARLGRPGLFPRRPRPGSVRRAARGRLVHVDARTYEDAARRHRRRASRTRRTRA